MVGSVILMASMIITKVLGLIYKIPLTNILGGEGMSYYSSAYSIFMPVFAIAVSGLTTALSRIVSENLSFKRYKNALKIRRVSLLFFSFTGLVFTVLTLAVGYPICVFVLGSKDAFLSLAALAPGIFFGSIMSVQRGFFEGGRNMMPTFVSEVIESILKVSLGIGGAYLALFLAEREYAVSSTVFGQVCADRSEFLGLCVPYISAFSLLGVTLSTAIATIYLFIISKRKSYRFSQDQINRDKVTDRKRTIIIFLVSLAVPMALSCVITTIASIVDMLTISPILSNVIERHGAATFLSGIKTSNIADVPAFMYGSFTGLALTVFGLVPSLTAMLGKSALPNISHLYAKGDIDSVRRQSNGTLLVTNIIAIPAGLAIVVFSKEILTVLFKNRTAEIEASTLPLSVLGVGVWFISLTVTTFSLLQSIGKERTPIYILLAAMPIKIILNIVLLNIPALGVTGAAIATVIFYIATALASVIVYMRNIKCKFQIINTVLKPLYAGINCIMAAVIANNLLSKCLNSIVAFLISCGISVIIYILSASLLFKINKKTLKSRFLL